MEAVSIHLDEYRSKHDWSEHLESAATRGVLLGSDCEVAEAYYCIRISDSCGTTTEIPLISCGAGIKPAWLLRPHALLLGFNRSVAAFALNDFHLIELVKLPWLFRRFFTDPSLLSLPHVLIDCEVAVMAVDALGQVIWTVETDIIEGHTVVGNQLEIRAMDGSCLVVDPLTGMSRRTR